MQAVGWLGERWIELGALAISFAAIWQARRATKVAESRYDPHVKFELTCRDLSIEERRAVVDLVTVNMSELANSLTRVQLSLMDGPPSVQHLSLKDITGVELPLAAMSETSSKELFKEGVRVEATAVDPERKNKSVGAGLARNDFTAPINLAPKSAVGFRIEFELPEVLPDYAFDSLRLSVQGRDIHGRLWEGEFLLADSLVESCRI